MMHGCEGAKNEDLDATNEIYSLLRDEVLD